MGDNEISGGERVNELSGLRKGERIGRGNIEGNEERKNTNFRMYCNVIDEIWRR